MVAIIYCLIGILLSFLSSQFIAGGDSGEFSTVALTWSIPHPPGYPLYSLLANLIRFLPLGTVPWRISLLSLIPAVITSYLIFKILRINSVSPFIAFLSSILFLTLFPVWQYTLIPEVFLLSAMLIALATYSIFVYLKTGDMRFMYLFCFLLGLNISHHHIFVLFVPAWIFLLWKKVSFSKKNFLISLLLVLGGAVFYLYAPLASHFNPPLDWENAKTLTGFFRLILRSTYGTFNAYSGSRPDGLNQFYDFLAILLFILQDFRIPGVILLIISFVVGRRIKKTLFTFIVIASLVQIGFLTYTNFILTIPFSTAMYERFLINLYFVFCLGCGLSMHYLLTVFKRYNMYMLAIFSIYVCILGMSNFKSIRYIRDLRHFDTVGSDILNSIPKNAIFYVGSDNTYFPTLYHLFGRKERPDLFLLQLNLIRQPFYMQKLRQEKKLKAVPKTLSEKDGSLERLFKSNERQGIYLESPLHFGYWLPYGLLWKYYSTADKMNADVNGILRRNEWFWEKEYRIPALTLAEKNILHLQVVQDFYLNAYGNYSKLLFVDKQYAKALGVIEMMMHFKPNDLSLKITRLNLLVYQKKCNEASLYKKAAHLDDANLPTYYSVCDPTHKKKSK